MLKKYKKSSINSSIAKYGETEYTVEKVIDKHVNPLTGSAKYFVKWKDYSDTDNTWEPEYFLDCPNLIAEFEANMKQKNVLTATIINDTHEQYENNSIIGFRRGFQPDRILAATNSSGQLLFLMKWANTDEIDLVPAVEANDQCPGVVLDFYERHIILLTTSKNTKKLLSGKRNKKVIKIIGFDEGLEPERIIGTTNSSGQLMFLMKWANTHKAELVPAKQASIRCPRIVINFYEERLTWRSPTDEKYD